MDSEREDIIWSGVATGDFACWENRSEGDGRIGMRDKRNTWAGSVVRWEVSEAAGLCFESGGLETW